MICYEELTDENSLSLSCKHTFCKGCWFEYLKDAVDDGPHGIEAKCMQTGCNLKVDHTVFDSILASSP